MKLKIAIDKTSLKRIQKTFSSYSDKVLQPIREANEKSSRQLVIAARKNLKINGTDDTGRLRASLMTLDTELRGLIYNVGTDVDYSLAVEEGAGSGKLSNEEVKDLGGWVKRKLGVTGEALPFVLHAVASKIELEGTDAQPFLLPAAVETRANHVRNMKQAIRTFNDRL